MKKLKRIVCTLMALCCLLQVLPVPARAEETLVYDAEAAVAYAAAHWNDGVGLCAQFVSACLKAGGITIPNKSWFKGSESSYDNCNGTLGQYVNPHIAAAAQLKYLGEVLGLTVIKDPAEDQMELGDVVFMYRNYVGNYPDGHATIITKVENGEAYYSAHNKDRYNEPVPINWCSYLIKMPGNGPETPEEPPVEPEQPPVEPEQPPVEPEQPPVEPEQPPVEPEQPPVEPEQPPVEPEQPPVEPEQPPVEPEQPPVEPEQPPVEPEQPPMEPEQPPVEPEQPPVEPEQPPVEPEQPPVEPEQPPVEPEQPPVEPEQPPVEPEQPPVEPEQPPVEPEQPPVEPEQPPVTPEQPPVEPEQPPVTPETPPVEPETPPVIPEIPQEQPATGFADVPADTWFTQPVAWAVEHGITQGTSATTFGPDEQCTRGQVVTFLWRAAGCPEPAADSNPFSDVNAADYYYKAVLWAVEHGITQGTSAATFSPEDSCTRSQVVTFLWRFRGQPQMTGASPFGDVAADQWYAGAVLWAVENGITQGTSATTFGPDETCIRSQVVTFLYRCEG